MPADILLVIPCYKERDRLPNFLPHLLAALSESGMDVSVMAVDDGSGADQQAWLTEYCRDLAAQFPQLRPPLLCPVNQGKGGAVYSGWETCQGERWLGFVDSDGAISPEEVVRVFRLLDPAQADHAVFAVRTGEAGTRVHRTWRRRISGRVFRWLVRALFHFPLPDTQCGFKLLPREILQSIRPGLREQRFCFDVELAHALLQSGVRIEAIPISWSESPGSRLGALSVLHMARSIVALRRRLGDWRKPPTPGAKSAP